jgi:hypothetical protein
VCILIRPQATLIHPPIAMHVVEEQTDKLPSSESVMVSQRMNLYSTKFANYLWKNRHWDSIVQ